MNKRSWLGNRLMWHPTQTTVGSRGRAANVFYRRERIPWLGSKKIITAFIGHDDFCLRFYDTPRLDDLSTDKCFMKIESFALSISELAEFLFWPDSEAVYTEFSGRRLTEVYPSNLFVDQLLTRWTSVKKPGWYLIDRGTCGVSFVSEMAGIDNSSRHAIELTDHEFAVYKCGLLQSSALAERDQLIRLDIEQLDIDRLRTILLPDDAVTVRYLARLTQRWLYELAVEYENP